ncbi:hypothetical protein BTN82_05240 [Pseudomonas chlororaphis]|uniref:Uncharacterized protein n=1 Tax=Pseudomonas chlororaphis TaxID=587753 RepID=A0A1Q8EWF0_9PSED|nr:hypothetical protein BTN82_05240 [Pseudomonas chlororaphis]
MQGQGQARLFLCVGASWLTMAIKDDAGYQAHCGVLESIASQLAPTREGGGQGAQNGGYLKAKRRPEAAV